MRQFALPAQPLCEHSDVRAADSEPTVMVGARQVGQREYHSTSMRRAMQNVIGELVDVLSRMNSDRMSGRGGLCEFHETGSFVHQPRA